MNGFSAPTGPARIAARSASWKRDRRFAKAAILGSGALVVLLGVAGCGSIPDVSDDAAVTSETTADTDTPLGANTTVAPGPTEAPVAMAAALTVTRVIDGDTVEMSDGATIRLIGIDTPERGDCGYQEATDTLGLILYGQTVILTSGARDDVDKYSRLLRYLDLGNGVDANLAMVESGQAIARYDSRDGYGEHTREAAYVAADTGSQPFCAVPAPVAATIVPAVTPAPVATAAPVVPQPPTNVSYANCDAVRAAGAAPIRAGDPGFQPKFDRDNDGVGCE